MTENNRDAYYDRIKAIVGSQLTDKALCVYTASFLGETVELLASCGITRFSFEPQSSMWPAIIQRRLTRHNTFEDRWDFSAAENPALILAGWDESVCRAAYDRARKTSVPLVMGVMLKSGVSLASIVFPGQPFPWNELALQSHKEIPTLDTYLQWIDLQNQLANIAKAVLLHETSWERQDFNALFAENKTTVLLSHATWPWMSRYLNTENPQDRQWLKGLLERIPRVTFERMPYVTPKHCNLRGKTVLVVGLGSLGSVAAKHLETLGANIVGIDGKEVSLHNPVRQLYATSDIGIPKAFALAHILAGKPWENYKISLDAHEVRFTYGDGDRRMFAAIREEMEDSKAGAARFNEILDIYTPDLVVFATAHPAEFRMADAARKRGIPHVVGRCYARARWFEVTSINPAHSPCFGCLQGHLYTGAPPSLTEEELARYEPQQQITLVQGEPATRIETARCADTIARMGVELLMPSEDCSEWFRRMMREERNCLIGGNYAEYKNDDWTYGIESPGGVALYGVINFVGSETEQTKTCLYCARTHEVLIHRRPVKNPAEERGE